MNNAFPIVRLGNYTQQISSRNHTDLEIEVFSVTNSEGFKRSTDYFSKEVFSKNLKNYKVVLPGEFAYNPSRINVGSIDFLKQDNPVLVSPLYIVFKCNESLSPEYLLKYLKGSLGNSQVRANTQGAVRDSLKYSGLENIKIPLPSLPEQIRIATLLSKVETLIIQRKIHLQQLDTLLKSIFLDLFGDPVKNEKGWEKVRLEELGSINRGVSKHRPRNAPELLGGKYPLIQTGEVSNSGTHIKSYTQTYSDIGFAQSKLWPSGTLCITIAANIAKTGILTFEACFPDSVVGVSVFQDKANGIYIHGLFWFFQEILEKNAPAAAQKNINLETLRKLSVPTPPLSLQNHFAKIVEKAETLKTHYEQSLADLETLYTTLSQKAFSGTFDLSLIQVK